MPCGVASSASAEGLATGAVVAATPTTAGELVRLAGVDLTGRNPHGICALLQAFEHRWVVQGGQRWHGHLQSRHVDAAQMPQMRAAGLLHAAHLPNASITAASGLRLAGTLVAVAPVPPPGGGAGAWACAAAAVCPATVSGSTPLFPWLRGSSVPEVLGSGPFSSPRAGGSCGTSGLALAAGTTLSLQAGGSRLLAMLVSHVFVVRTV